MWSYDFLTERTEDGRQLRILVVKDEFTRECLAIELARSFTARDVSVTLRYLFAVRGAPEHLLTDNGPELVAKEIQNDGSGPVFARATSKRQALGRTARWRASTAGSVTSRSTGSSF